MVSKNEELKRGEVYDTSPVKEKYEKILEEKKKKNLQLSYNPEDKPDIQSLFKIDQRRLDRSVKSEVDEH